MEIPRHYRLRKNRYGVSPVWERALLLKNAFPEMPLARAFYLAQPEKEKQPLHIEAMLFIHDAGKVF